MQTNPDVWEVSTSPDKYDVGLTVRREIVPEEYEYLTELGIDGAYFAYGGAELVYDDLPELPIPLDVAAAVFLGLHRLFGNHDPKGTRQAMKAVIRRIETGTYA